ncbi:MAG: polysaccharide lyase [Sandaracinaceae bacterium]
MRRLRPLLCLLPLFALALVVVPASPAHAQLDTWAEGSDDADDGATRDFYNRGAGLAWRQLLGDWRDRDGTLHGDNAWASTNVVDDDSGRYVEFDVTTLVQAQRAGTARDLGFFLRGTGGGGPIDFASREAADAGQHPELVVTSSSGETTLAAVADTYLRSSTFQAAGETDQLRVGNDANLLVRFDLTGLEDVSAATLRLFTTRQFGGGLDIGVFEVATSEPGARVAEAGLAADFERDEGIGAHEDVVFFEGFESADWADSWTSPGGEFDVVDTDSAFGFEALEGSALRVLMPEGENTALNLRYDFMDETGAEPDEIYLRYYLRFGSDWDQSVDGGKLPGISGTYGVAGWGGRRSDGSNGWSARGLYRETVPSANNPLGGRTPIGSYVYHADMESTFGDGLLWNQSWDAEGRGGIVQRGRWVSLETYVRMNTPGETDGVIRAWVDGVLAYETTTMRFRTVDTLHIERIWMNIYHGGTAVSPYDQHAFIDNVVVARSYIGPMSGTLPPPTDAGVPMRDAGTSDGGAAPPDAGTTSDGAVGLDAGGTDGGTSPDTDGGCSCRVARSRSHPTGLWLAAGMLAVLGARRRRRLRRRRS